MSDSLIPSLLMSELMTSAECTTRELLSIPKRISNILYILFRKHCVCTDCSDCLCRVCRHWTRVASWTFLASPHLYLPTNHTTSTSGPRYILLSWFHASLVLQHLDLVAQLFRQHLNHEQVAQVKIAETIS